MTVKVLVLLIIIGIIVFLIHSYIPTYYNKKINKDIIRKTSKENEICLTFDDGPDKKYIYNLLDTLEENNVKAIFFMVAENAKKNKKEVQEIIKRGHKIGLHSWQHKNALLYSYFYTKKDFENSIEILKSFGINEYLYRPPWGHSNIFTNYFAKKYNMTMVYWDVMAEDWSKHSTPETISDKLLKRTKPKSIICLHDAGENSGGAKGAPLNTINALKIAIPKLKEKGYRFTVEL